MSDLQDIIVSSSVKAFNSGLAHGVIQERERIIALLDSLDISFTEYEGTCHGAGDALDLIELIKGDQK